MVQEKLGTGNFGTGNFGTGNFGTGNFWYRKKLGTENSLDGDIKQKSIKLKNGGRTHDEYKLFER